MISTGKGGGKKIALILLLTLLTLLPVVQGCRGKKRTSLPVDKVEFNPEDEPWHVAVEVGIIAAQNGHYDRAITEFRRSISMNPDNALAYSYLGLVYAKVGDPERARTYFEKAVRLDPKSEIALENLGVLLAEKKDYRRAMKCLEMALEINHSNINARFNLAQLCKVLGETSRSIELFIELINLKPEIPAFHYHLASLYQLKGFTEQALEEYARTVELSPGRYTAAYYQLATIHHARKQYDEARANYIKVLEIDGHHLQSCIGLGDLFFDQADYNEALTYYRKALSISPDNRYCINSLAKVRNALNREDGAQQKN